MSAYANMDTAVAGLQYGLDPLVETGAAQEFINFGEPVFGHTGVEDKVWGAHRDKATLTLDGDLVASNVITTTINGTAIATTYGSSHAATMTAHIAAINAKAEMVALGVVAAAGSTNRIIVLTVKGVDLTAASVVTLGAGQAASATVYGAAGKFLGVALLSQRSTRDYGAGTSGYEIGDAVNILREGTVWVPVSVAVQDKEPAYAITEVTDQGKFTNASSGTYDVGGYFRSNRSNNMAVLEVRGLK